MATKTLRVFAEYTSTGFVPMPTAGNIDYGYTLGSTFPATTPTTFQTDNPDLVVTVTAMTDFYVWIRINGTAWNPSYTRNVRVYPDSPNINNVVMNMIIATGPAGIGAYTQIVQTSNRLYFNGATTDAVYNSKFAGKTYINELNFGTAPGLATVATTGAYADLTGKPSLATVATSGLFTDLSSKPSGTAPLSYNSGTNSFVITQANTSTNGYLSSTDWNTFNNKFATPSGTTLQYVDGTGALQTFPVLASADKLVINVRNSSGVSMPKGSVVYINGATGNKPTVALAQGNSDASSAQTLGLLQATLANNAEGNVVIVGAVADLNTSAFTEGQQLYLSPTTAGAYTTTKPYAPNHLVYVGVVTRSHVSLGVIEVKVQNGYEMDELHNVSAQSPSNNDGLFYNTTTSLWEKKSIATVLGYTPYNGTNTSIKALFSASAPLSYSDGAFSISQASASTNGYLSSTDWNTFNNKSSNLGTVTSVAMTVPTELSVSGTPITTSGTLALSLTAGYIIPTTANVAQWENAYTNRITSLTLNGSSGTATLAANVLNIPSYTLIGLGGQPALSGTGFVKISGTTISYDNSSYLPSTGGIMTSSIGFADSGKRGIYGTMGGNDSWFIGAGALATDNGFIEIATGDNGNEPIYVRQYSGDPYTTGTVTRTATILDGSGNTIFPNTLTATTLIKSGGTSSQFLKADGSVDSSVYLTTASASSTYLTIATASSTYQTIITNPVTGTGTTNYIPKFTSSSAIGNSAITDDGTTVTLVSRALGGTTAAFTGRIGTSLSSSGVNLNNSSFYLNNTAGTKGAIFGYNDTADNFYITILQHGVATKPLAIDASATTFSNSVTATNLYSTGNSGIGTLNAQSINNGISLTIGDSATQHQPYLAFRRNSTGGYWAGINWYDQTTRKSFIEENSDFDLRFGTSNTLRLTIASTGAATFASSISATSATFSGRIGTSLSSSGSNFNNSSLYVNNTAGTKGAIFGYNDTADNFYFTSIQYGVAYKPLVINASIASFSDKVGIATTSPSSLGNLTVVMPNNSNGTGLVIKAINDGGTASQPAVTFLNGSSATIAQIVADNGTGYLAFNTGSTSTERLRITYNGMMSASTTSSVSLELNSTDANGGYLSFKRNGNGYGYVGSAYHLSIGGSKEDIALAGLGNITFASGGSLNIRGQITAGGNWLVGTTSDPGYKLYVSGTIYATGNITANSDLTLKKNLKLIDNPIDKLMQLNGYAYQWKANDEHQYGVIAQEVEKILPYAVSTGNDGIKGVSYNQITPLLIEGFKSHESEITILKARVKYLESKLA